MDKEQRFIMVAVENQYTPWRKFLAWVGFISLLAIVIAVIVLVVTGNIYLSTHGI